MYFKLALKNVTRQKRRSLFLILGIVFAVFAVTLVGGVASGLRETFLKNQSVLFNGHITLYNMQKNSRGTVYSQMDDPEPYLATAREILPDLGGYTLRNSNSASLINGTNSRNQVLNGVQFSREDRLLEELIFEAGGRENLADPRAIIISFDMAQDLQVGIRDEVLVKTKSTAGIQNVQSFRVSGILSEDMGTFANIFAYCHLETFNELRGNPAEAFGELNLYIEDFYASGPKAALWQEALLQGGYSMYPRPEPGETRDEFTFNNELQDELEEGETLGVIQTIEETMAFPLVVAGTLDIAAIAVMLVITLVILIGLVNSFLMTILERQKEIGTQRALGMRKGSVIWLFFLEISILVWIGILGGILLAWGLGTFLSSIPLDFGHSFFGLFLRQGRLAIVFQIGSIVSISLLLYILAAISAIIPTYRASKVSPAIALRATA
jgi:putative ABC transport system permease protein